jgi:hypothetical protein
MSRQNALSVNLLTVCPRKNAEKKKQRQETSSRQSREIKYVISVSDFNADAPLCASLCQI